MGTCTLCEAGKYKGFPGGAECVSCPPHSHTWVANGDTSVPDTFTVGNDDVSDCLCNIGFSGTVTGNAEDCTACPAGQFKALVGTSACVACPSDSNTWHFATTGLTATTGNVAAYQCMCDKGHYGVIEGTSSVSGGTCENCPTGQYKADVGTERCIACPANSDAPTESDAASDCSCNAGFEGYIHGDDRTVGQCNKCPTGKYKNLYEA